MITEDYISFDIAKLLKEKGFDVEDCEVHYDPTDHTSYNITLQMVMKWLRKIHNIGIFPTTFYRYTSAFDGHNYGSTLINLKTFNVIATLETFPADSYEETCELAIKYCLENLI